MGSTPSFVSLFTSASPLKKHCFKLLACPSFIALMDNIIAYKKNKTDGLKLWKMKHKELI